MTGWRLGYGIMPPKLADAVARLQTNSNSCTASFTQVAGIEALTGSQSKSRKMVREFKARRDLIVDGLNAIPGFKCLKPKGSFYVFPNITGTGMKSKDLETFLLEKAGVAALSGTSFGKYGEGYLRFSYANSQENLKKALDKIRRALK
jgi:aspartate aminotransferase